MSVGDLSVLWKNVRMRYSDEQDSSKTGLNFARADSGVISAPCTTPASSKKTHIKSLEPKKWMGSIFSMNFMTETYKHSSRYHVLNEDFQII